ncbi:CcmD family protein [candidate division KSB1 bacterium]|nr:CcmD family protein [candidate division KSB1 bacterium]
MKNIYFLVTAYSLIWVVVFGYVFNMMKKQKGLAREIERLKNLLQKNEQDKNN